MEINVCFPYGKLFQLLQYMKIYGEYMAWTKKTNIIIFYIDGLAQDCGIFSALALEIPQTFTKPLI